MRDSENSTNNNQNKKIEVKYKRGDKKGKLTTQDNRPNNASKNKKSNSKNSNKNTNNKNSNTKNSNNKNKNNKKNKKTNKKERNTTQNAPKPKRKKRVVRKIEKVDYTVYAIIGLVFIMFFMQVVGYAYRSLSRDSVELIELDYSTIYEPVDYDALIMRDEKVYKSEASGELVLKVQNKDKAAKNEVIAQIVDKNAVSDYDNSINEINGTLSELAENNEVSDAVKEDIITSNKQIKKILDNRNYRTTRDMYTLQETVSNVVKERNNEIISDLDDEKKEEAKQANNDILQSIKAKKSGIVSTDIDGYEEVYAPENIDNITETQIKTDKINTTTNKTSVAKGDEVVKVVEDNDWYITSYIDATSFEDEGIEQGKKRNIYLSNAEGYQKVNAVVTNATQKKNTIKVDFKLHSYINEFLDYRDIKIRLNEDEYKGMKLPTSTLRNKTMLKVDNDFVYVDDKSQVNYVMRKQADGSFLRTKVELYKTLVDEGYSLVASSDKTLFEGDILCQDNDEEKIYQIPKSIEINGVMVVNTGVATFREVYIDEKSLRDSKVSGYYILQEDKNTNVRIYDKVVANANEVEEGDLVYK